MTVQKFYESALKQKLRGISFQFRFSMKQLIECTFFQQDPSCKLESFTEGDYAAHDVKAS